MDTLTYNCEITSVKTRTYKGQEDVITNIYWHLEGTDEEGVKGGFRGATSLFDDDIDTIELVDFIEYNSLTEDLLIDWVYSRADLEHAKGIIYNEISATYTKLKETTELPWKIKDDTADKIESGQEESDQ